MAARARLWSLFGGLALTSVIVLGGAARLLARFALPGPLVWAGPAALLVAAQALVWPALERSWIWPSTALARELRLLLHAYPDRQIAAPAGHRLGDLVPALQALAERSRRGHPERTELLAKATAHLREHGSRLEAMLRGLADGLIVCAADQRICLLEPLEAEGVRTPGDALELAGRAGALRRRQLEAFGPRRGRRLVAAG